MESTEELVKLATQHTRQEIELIIEQWSKSGKTKKDFCEAYPLKYQTFISWTKRKKKELAAKEKASPGFIPLQVQKESRTVFAEVKFTNGNIVFLYEYVGTGYLRSLLG